MMAGCLIFRQMTNIVYGEIKNWSIKYVSYRRQMIYVCAAACLSQE